MFEKFIKVGIGLIGLLLLGCLLWSVWGGCRQASAKYYGGTISVTLPPGEKLVTITWKDADLWYLTRPMKPGESPDSYVFQESSQWGLVEGKVKIQEVPAR